MSHILVVDDSDVLRGIMLRTLRQADLDVGFLEARSAPDALAIVNREPRPCAVLCDMSLPGPDSVQVVRTLRERTDVPIVMLAPETCIEPARAAVAAGASAWVAKPFTAARIRDVLMPLLSVANAHAGERQA